MWRWRFTCASYLEFVVFCLLSLNVCLWSRLLVFPSFVVVHGFLCLLVSVGVSFLCVCDGVFWWVADFKSPMKLSINFNLGLQQCYLYYRHEHLTILKHMSNVLHFMWCEYYCYQFFGKWVMAYWILILSVWHLILWRPISRGNLHILSFYNCQGQSLLVTTSKWLFT